MGSRMSCTVRCISTTSSSTNSASPRTRHESSSSSLSAHSTSTISSATSVSLSTEHMSARELQGPVVGVSHSHNEGSAAHRRVDAFEGISNFDDAPKQDPRNPLVSVRGPVEPREATHNLQRKKTLLSGGRTHYPSVGQPTMLTFEPILSIGTQGNLRHDRPSHCDAQPPSMSECSSTDIIDDEGGEGRLFSHQPQWSSDPSPPHVSPESPQDNGFDVPAPLTLKLKKRKVKASRRRRRYVRDSMALGRSVSFSNSQPSQPAESSEDCLNAPPSSPLTFRRHGRGSVTFDIPESPGQSSMIVE